jgi:hypothetical protein
MVVILYLTDKHQLVLMSFLNINHLNQSFLKNKVIKKTPKHLKQKKNKFLFTNSKSNKCSPIASLTQSATIGKFLTKN